MKLNHINLPIDDVDTTRQFFEQFFNFKCLEIKGDNALAILKGEDDFILVLMSKAFNKNAEISYPDAFHIGFLVKSDAQVDAAYQRLIAGNAVPEKPPGKIRGQYGFYFRAPGNLLIEVTSY
jgi:catechol 2,3-dioxygenase-like lactoylglutathione lyase family enzyme